jgi:hypothetical protein
MVGGVAIPGGKHQGNSQCSGGRRGVHMGATSVRDLDRRLARSRDTLSRRKLVTVRQIMELYQHLRVDVLRKNPSVATQPPFPANIRDAARSAIRAVREGLRIAG